MKNKSFFFVKSILISMTILTFSEFGLSAENITEIVEKTDRSALEQSKTEQAIDQLVNNVMAEFLVPGVAVGIIKENKIIHLKGYGVSDLYTKQATDQNTIFKIASNTKAFTTAALAILVEQGKVNWNDKVIQHLPNFKMYDPWVTKEFNIRDLLTHRSGLRIGAGDLMIWPEPTLFTREDIINNLQYLKPVSSFRDEYAYDNLLYIVAGELVAKVSGESWGSFIQSNIFEPLQMKNCFAGGVDTTIHSNLVAPHAVVNNELVVLEENRIKNNESIMAAAGGIKCSVSDLANWVSLQINRGETNDGTRLYSEKQSEKMWTPVTALPLSIASRELDKSTYKAYALGWRVSDYFGYRRVSHTGTLAGSMSQIVILPELDLGIVILTNQQSSDARNTLTRELLQEFVPLNKGRKKIDWMDYYKKKKEKEENRKHTHTAKKIKSRDEKNIANTKSQNKLLGTYNDPWFGAITIQRELDDVVFRSKKSPRMIGKLFAHDKNQWWVKWNDRSFEADAWLYFEFYKDDKNTDTTGLRMKSISSDADFSFDFEDLNFVKQQSESQTIKFEKKNIKP